MTATAAGIRSLVAAGDRDAAAAAAGQLIAGSFGLPVAAVELTVDEYSLNSVSGRVRFADGHTEFFKFHQEEGEEETVAEYYRARLLGLAQAVCAGSEPEDGTDELTRMLDAVTPA